MVFNPFLRNCMTAIIPGIVIINHFTWGVIMLLFTSPRFMSSILMSFTVISTVNIAVAQQGYGTTLYQELSSSLADENEKMNSNQSNEAEPVSPWQRANYHPPLYPRALALDKIEGCAVFQTTINSRGETEALRVVRSVPAALSKPNLIESAALLKWTLPPGIKGGQEVKRFRINFCMGKTEEHALARCEQFAALPCSTA